MKKVLNKLSTYAYDPVRFLSPAGVIFPLGPLTSFTQRNPRTFLKVPEGFSFPAGANRLQFNVM